jgi:hypothetical protein
MELQSSIRTLDFLHLLCKQSQFEFLDGFQKCNVADVQVAFAREFDVCVIPRNDVFRFDVAQHSFLFVSICWLLDSANLIELHFRDVRLNCYALVNFSVRSEQLGQCLRIFVAKLDLRALETIWPFLIARERLFRVATWTPLHYPEKPQVGKNVLLRLGNFSRGEPLEITKLRFGINLIVHMSLSKAIWLKPLGKAYHSIGIADVIRAILSRAYHTASQNTSLDNSLAYLDALIMSAQDVTDVLQLPAVGALAIYSDSAQAICPYYKGWQKFWGWGLPLPLYLSHISLIPHSTQPDSG